MLKDASSMITRPLKTHLTLERSCWSLWRAWLAKVVLLSCLIFIFLLKSYCYIVKKSWARLVKQVKKRWYCTGTLKTPTDLSVSDMIPSPLLGVLPLRQVVNRTIERESTTIRIPG